MTTALLTYVSNPTQVAISAGGSPSQVGITFLIVNKSAAPVTIGQIVLAIPQGDGSTDLIAAKTTFSTGSVHSSNGSSWSLSPANNQAILMPVSAQGCATLAPKDSLQFTLSGLQVNASGAGQSANIAVLESIYNGGDGSTQIPIQKIAPGFYIESFYLDQYNVAVDTPVTVTWKVVGALSSSVTAKIIKMASKAPERHGPGCGVGTDNPVCDGTISSGTDFSDSHTCNVQGATVFTLHARGKGPGGDVTLSSQLLVTVNEPAIHFVTTSGYISLGADVTLNWVSADAAKLTLQAVPLSGSGQPSTYDITDDPVGKKTFQPLVDTAYWLNAYTSPNPPPNTPPATQLQLPVRVELPRWSVNLSASDVPTPAYPGDTITLDWAVLNVDHCELTCDQPGFVPQNNLLGKGPLQVKLPDPDVANGTATFTLTPVQYGGLGNFTPQSTPPIPISTLPYFSKDLAADPATMAASGGSCTLTWALDHAEAAVLTSNLLGATPQSVDPSAGKQVVQIPSIVIPTPIIYTLTASRQNRKYISTSTAQVQCVGDISVLWSRSPKASGTSSSYLDSLYLLHPNERIRKVRLDHMEDCGVTAILIWYGDAVDPDYALPSQVYPNPDASSTLVIPPGDYINLLQAWYFEPTDDEGNYPVLWGLKLTTAGGLSVAQGSTPDGQDNNGPYSVSIPEGDQAIAFVVYEGSGLGDIGLVSCTKAYGQ